MVDVLKGAAKPFHSATTGAPTLFASRNSLRLLLRTCSRAGHPSATLEQGAGGYFLECTQGRIRRSEGSETHAVSIRGEFRPAFSAAIG